MDQKACLGILRLNVDTQYTSWYFLQCGLHVHIQDVTSTLIKQTMLKLRWKDKVFPVYIK